jgi:hypothetical protein
MRSSFRIISTGNIRQALLHNMHSREVVERFMIFSEDVLVEDWQGLESETERLLIIYGYPTITVAQLETDVEESETTVNPSR